MCEAHPQPIVAFDSFLSHLVSQSDSHAVSHTPDNQELAGARETAKERE